MLNILKDVMNIARVPNEEHIFQEVYMLEWSFKYLKFALDVFSS